LREYLHRARFSVRRAGLANKSVLKLRSHSSDLSAMRHARLWLLLIGVGSLLAEAVAAIAVLGRGPLPGKRLR
jgi:hypothetical protein